MQRALPQVTVVTLLVLCLSLVASQMWKTDLGPCYRDCTADPTPKTCYYQFTEEIYSSLTPACRNCSSGVEKDCYSDQCVAVDGVAKSINTINRQFPGPGVHVCVGDTIQVDLKVQMLGHAETIHWHGIFQSKTPWFDGVPWVTQCPIIYGSTFRYEFLAEKPGTFFWHSHSGLHKVNGISGALVIKQHKGLDPHAARYDYDLAEHVVLLHDWNHNVAEFVFPGLVTRIIGQPSDVLLVNGQGQYTDPTTNTTSVTPLAKFVIEPGKRYRFRIINSGSFSCPIQIQFEDHVMTVIATDSFDVRPRRTNTLITISGERYDVIITGKLDSSRSAFWIYTRTVGFCQNRGTSEQRALLLYRGANSDSLPTTPPPSAAAGLPLGTVMNSLGDCSTAGQVCVAALHAIKQPSYSTTNPMAQRLAFVRLKFRSVTAAELFGEDEYDQFLELGTMQLVPVLNEISYSDPSAPFLTQPGESPHCDSAHLPADCAEDDAYCQCPHLVELPHDKVIDVITVDDSDTQANDTSTTLLSHPMHQHGTGFTCMGMGNLRSITNGTLRSLAVHEMYHNKTLPMLSHRPPTKDTLLLPGGGWIWFRFRSDNRGCWLYHCHFQYHMAAGMEMVFQFGKTEDLPKPPKNFPRCGNYINPTSDENRRRKRTPWYIVP